MNDAAALLRSTQRNSHLALDNKRLRKKAITKDLVIALLAFGLTASTMVFMVVGAPSSQPQREIGRLQLILEEAEEDYALCMRELLE